MKKINVINLIKYHSQKNEEAFKQEAYTIAKEFDENKDSALAQYIISLLSDANTFSPQYQQEDCEYIKKVDLDSEPILLPEKIQNNVAGIINAIGHDIGLNKFLFEGPPGTGKTESVKQIARILDRNLYIVDFDMLVDSKLGQTSKNIAKLFNDLKKLPQSQKTIILFDEIDAIAIDRINDRDIREMGRATSSILKGFDSLNKDTIIIATTNLFKSFDRALVRRFDAIVDFEKYPKEDLALIAENMMNRYIQKFKYAGRNVKLLKKILNASENLPYPGELKNLLKTSLAFSNPNNKYDYLKRLYDSLNCNSTTDAKDCLKTLQDNGFTVRDIEILTGVSKSQVSRKIKEVR